MVDGQLIFVSDLEGCLPESLSKKKQSNVVCSKDFFDKIDTFLSKKIYNKVAFLGDYFDKGNYFIDTIERIIELYEKYNLLNNPKKVHIILGNRDINKLRLFYELDNKRIKIEKNKINSTISSQLTNSKNNKNNKHILWTLWQNFYKKYFNNILENNTNSLYNRFKIILEDSMGAKQASEADYLFMFKYFKNILENNTNINNINFTKLFNYGLIADYDPDYKVLLSHAGGIGSFLFHNQSYYNSIFEKFIPYDNILTYFNNIEIARRELMKKPKGSDIYNGNDIYEILQIINGPLKKFINNKDMSNFFLLQALGLKPNNVGGDHFVSFVQSCDCISCKGPININITNKNGKTSYDEEYELFLNKLVDLDIKFISFGHNPVCTPIPLIYRRPENLNIIFIANDLSNGYRDANINSIYKMPLAYVEKESLSNFNVGVGAFRESNNKNMLNSNISDLPESLKLFRPMIQKWTLNSVPEFNRENKNIAYTNKDILTFPARNGTGDYKPAKFKE
jgi:hypothetical protein